MAKKIYDFLPGHLKNSELETVFETTLDRVFSVGEMEKSKAFVGRKEKGIYNSNDIYLSYPATAYARDNYGLEPTFTNTDATDNVFYDDLLNALYNKGALTNDHRRLFKSTLDTVQLPIDIDKFVNYSMYYWIKPGFTTDASYQSSTKKHYVTIDKDLTATDFWKKNNSWYHYDDIKALITDANFTLISQALRPIIEFDKNIELSTISAATTESSSFTVPTFKSYDGDGSTYLGTDNDIKIFEYVTGSAYVNDTELGFAPKLKAGDYQSEYVFNIDLLSSSTYKIKTPAGLFVVGTEYTILVPGTTDFTLIGSTDSDVDTKFTATDVGAGTGIATLRKKLYIPSTFDYRNLRQELGDMLTVSEIELLQASKNSNTIDLYVDGQKQIGNYTYSSVTNKITMSEAVSGNVYVDYCTDTPVVYDGQTVFQRLNPSVEYNVDNESYVNTEMTHSLVFEHLVRIIETVSGLTGSSIANNNYRQIGTNTDKLRYANQGSVLISNRVDIKEAYFALTRDDYDPIKATEFLAGAYNGYKNKLLTTIISILESSASTTKTDLQILEEAISTISLGKHSSVSIFRDSTMLNFGENHSHYEELSVTVVNTAISRPVPTFAADVLNKKDLVVIRNNVIQLLNVDYTLNTGITEIENISPPLSTSDVITVRHYISIKETYVPPSATSLGIAPAYRPGIIVDNNYSPSVSFIQGHDGSLIPLYESRIDAILLAFETLISNNLADNTSTTIDSMNYGLYSTAAVDYSNAEKKYIMYPFFKKWMMRNNIDSLDNDSYDVADYKTWNYRAKNEESAGHWRGQLINAYGTDRPLQEPWKAIKSSKQSESINTAYGSTDFASTTFWINFIRENSLTCPVPGDKIVNNIIVGLGSAGGSGYTSPPLVTITHAEGSGATATAILTSGVVTNITVDSGGSRYYTTSPAVSIADELATVVSGAFVIGTVYTILVPGTTDFTLIGSADSVVDTTFTATGVGAGTGTATYVLGTGATATATTEETRILRTPNELFFGSAITSSDIALMDQAWEFGDNSPVELAWTRSSEFAFAEFMLMLLSNPFKIIYDYSSQIKDIITYSNKNEGIDTSLVVADKTNYSFKLGSKLGGFVNNFKLQSENNSLSNSRFTELPEDNFDLFVHAGVPNRSEFFSAIVIEKVSLDSAHPEYSLATAKAGDYIKGTIVLNPSDKKYYKRKITDASDKEKADPNVIVFDYSAWTLISQPKTDKFGFKVHGYDEINPTFYSMGWDKASSEKTFSTAGDKLTLKQWQSGEYYRLDSYILWNDTPYVCLTNHTSTTFDDNNKDWKAVTEWPTTNKTQAKGYKKLVDDTVKNYNYGDILESVDDVAHLIMGYEHYLGLVGWEFTDSDEFGDVINWENLLNKFLEWQSEQHDIGDFITLTPLLTGGSFDATYGVASVSSETFKNYYRVVDASGRLIPSTELSFHTDGAKLTFTSTVPIYGMKMDIRDIEHAFVVDRTDSYGDVIYDPHSHTRNLRMQIDCNRTVDWDGTMSVDGYLVNDNQLIPNFDTMIEETRHYRNTLVDQGLSVINKLKSNHYGYTTRAYLSNSGIERESQLEFYKGFLSHKGTDSSIDKIINNNGNFKNITHADMWAIKLNDYGHVSSQLTMTKDVTVNDMITDPFLIEYDNNGTLLTNTTKNNTAIKTTGYVDESDVNYVASTHESLTDLTGSSLYEGDTAWVQFDTDRDWDVVRLSEVAEISYVGETSDNQLYIGMLTEIDSSYDAKAIYIKISSDEIDPTIDGYYLLIANGTKTVSGTTIYEYLVFEEDFEPVIVEIDSTTTNSIFVPTNADSGVEAIGSVSNPTIASSDVIVIDGTSVSYTPGTASASGISILGTVANPTVSEGEQARFVIYNSGGLVENGTNTTVTFSGTVATTTGSFSSTVGDEVTIDGTTLTVDHSGSQSISQTSTATRSSALTTGNTVVINTVTKTVTDISVTGTTYTGPTTVPEYLIINGTQIEITVASDLTAIINTINSSPVPVTASDSSGALMLTTSATELIIDGGFLNDLGLSTTSSIEEYKLDNLATEINNITDITCNVDANNRMTIASSGTSMVISGTALAELGITAGTYNQNSDPTVNSVSEQINALNILGVTGTVVSGTIKITSTNQTLVISEDSGNVGAMGFAGPVNLDATEIIKNDLNSQVFTTSTTTATRTDRQILITSSESSIVTSNITGNSLSDIGITAGTFANTSTLSLSAVEFAAQVTSATSVVAGVSSDGRMIFTNNNVSMSFSGTTEAMLTKIGLALEYSNVTTSSSFKAMLWKSVRYTPNFNGVNFSEFTSALGINSTSKLWIDNYDTNGWAVLSFNLGTYTTHARQSKTINTDLTKRLIVQDGENFINHQLYDPLNLKMPGTIVSKLEYVAWNDPASYDTTGSSDIWLDEKIDKIWWDTDLARFYRYNDYGDSNGNLNVNYVKKYWGRLVASSEVVVNKWTKSRILPEDITTYNTKKYYDELANKEVTDYFYWSSDSDDCKEIAMLINSEGPKNKFLPVGISSVIISNNATSYDSETIGTTLEYQTETGIRKGNTDWELLSEATDYVVPKKFLNDMTESVSNVTILETHTAKIIASQLTDVNHAIIPVSWITGLAIGDIVVTTNSGTVKASYLSIDGSNLKISQTHTMIVGDILRVYKVESKTSNWFSNNTRARSNFASIINNTMSKKMLTALYSNYAQYLDTDDIIFSLSDWYITDNYKTIDAFSYLSTTRNFDMIAEYEKGIKSFKLKLPTHDEYYFEHDNVLKLVNRSNSALNVSFDSLVYPETSFTNYYNNAVGIQIHELMNMIEDYPDVSFINKIFFTMIDYLYTEKSYPSWLFKTSYIDLNLYNRELKQYAVYQRDSEEDVLEYVREAKPYHVKIREIKRIHSTADSMNATVTIDERNADTLLNFGIGISVPSGFFAPGTVYTILVPGTTDFTLIGATDNIKGTTFTATGRGTGTGTAQNGWRNHSRYEETLYDGIATTDIADDEYEQGALLRNRNTLATGTTGFDTGFVRFDGLESSVLRLQDYKVSLGGADADISIPGGTDGFHLDKTQFYIYDIYGRGYSIAVEKDTNGDDKTGTISAFDGTTLVVNKASLFDDASDTNKKLIAVEKPKLSTITAGTGSGDDGFDAGIQYTILSPGPTDFTLIGAADSVVGTVFTATGDGTEVFSAGSFIATNEYTITSLGADTLDTVTAGAFISGVKYNILTVGTTDYTLIGSSDSVVGTIFIATGVGIGTGTATSVNTTIQEHWANNGVPASSIATVGTIFTATGVGTGTGTATGNGTATRVVGTDVEFMLYDNKGGSGGTALTISNRALYTGVGHTFANGSTVYVLDTPLQLVRNNDEELENLL